MQNGQDNNKTNSNEHFNMGYSFNRNLKYKKKYTNINIKLSDFLDINLLRMWELCILLVTLLVYLPLSRGGPYTPDTDQDSPQY